MPELPRSAASSRRRTDRVGECATSAQAETHGPPRPGWGGSAHPIRDEILPTPAATEQNTADCRDAKEANEPPADASEEPVSAGVAVIARGALGGGSRL